MGFSFSLLTWWKPLRLSPPLSCCGLWLLYCQPHPPLFHWSLVAKSAHSRWLPATPIRSSPIIGEINYLSFVLFSLSLHFSSLLASLFDWTLWWVLVFYTFLIELYDGYVSIFFSYGLMVQEWDRWFPRSDLSFFFPIFFQIHFFVVSLESSGFLCF